MSRKYSGLNKDNVAEILEHLKEAHKACDMSAKNWPVIVVHVNYNCHEVAIKIRKYAHCEKVIKALCSKFGLSPKNYELKVKGGPLRISKDWPVSILENKNVFLEMNPFDSS